MEILRNVNVSQDKATWTRYKLGTFRIQV